jgi:putative chitinase
MDIQKLKGHIPDTVLAQIPSVMEKFKIDTPLELAHFLAQCGHESGNFKAVSENLNEVLGTNAPTSLTAISSLTE